MDNSSPAEKKIWELSLNWFLQWNICRNCVFLYAMKRWTHKGRNIISTDQSHRNCIHKWILHVEDRNCRLANSLVEVWFCFRRRTFGKNILLQNIEENILPSGLSNKNLHYTQTHTHSLLSSQSRSPVSFQPHRAAVCELHVITGLIKEACFHTSKQQPTSKRRDWSHYTVCQLWSFIHIQVVEERLILLRSVLIHQSFIYVEGKIHAGVKWSRWRMCILCASRARFSSRFHEGYQHFSRWRQANQANLCVCLDYFVKGQLEFVNFG